MTQADVRYDETILEGDEVARRNDTSAARAFSGRSLGQRPFPPGGIGTGTVSLGGRGNLQDWELFNRPGKGNTLARTFLALRVQPAGGEPVARVLEREYLPPFVGALGFKNGLVPSLPRF